MKCLKEPLARLANKQDGCTGAFFEGRYKLIAILDEEVLLSVCAYIDLNPVAAGIVALPEDSPHTSIKERVEHVSDRQVPGTQKRPTGVRHPMPSDSYWIAID